MTARDAVTCWEEEGEEEEKGEGPPVTPLRQG